MSFVRSDLNDRAALEITEVRIRPQNAKALLAFVSVTFNDCFVVRGLKIIDGMDGRFVAMPARQKKDNTFQDIAHPITREFRAHLEHVVLAAYRNEYEDGGEEESAEATHPEPARAVMDPELR
jgi:stage V sporulation protein G